MTDPRGSPASRKPPMPSCDAVPWPVAKPARARARPPGPRSTGPGSSGSIRDRVDAVTCDGAHGADDTASGSRGPVQFAQAQHRITAGTPPTGSRACHAPGTPGRSHHGLHGLDDLRLPAPGALFRLDPGQRRRGARPAEVRSLLRRARHGGQRRSHLPVDLRPHQPEPDGRGLRQAGRPRPAHQPVGGTRVDEAVRGGSGHRGAAGRAGGRERGRAGDQQGRRARGRAGQAGRGRRRGPDLLPGRPRDGRPDLSARPRIQRL